MNRPDLEPLPSELSHLLAVEKSRPAPSASMQARVLERIGNELLAGIPVAGPPIAGPPSALPAPPAGAMARFRLPLTVGLVALGGLSGAGLHALLQRPQRKVPPIMGPLAPEPRAAPMVLPPPRPAVIEPTPSIKVPRPEPPAPARRQAPATRPTAPPGDDDERLPRDGELAAERALLEQARMALARGKPADALALLSRHEQEFANGRLAEERQALTILSLAADHQLEAARSHAATFRREFPSSMLLRSIEAAIETSP